MSSRVQRVAVLTLIAFFAILGAAARQREGQSSRVEGAEESRRAESDMLRRFERRALLEAVIRGDRQLARLLVNDPVDFEARDEYGQTALMLTDDSDLCAQLLAKGADVNARSNYARTPLMLAIWNSRADLLPILIGAGADLFVRDDGRDTALIVAAGRGESRAIELLIEAGGDVNERLQDGSTILMRAAAYGHQGNVETLLRLGADTYLQDPNGLTAFDHALTTQHEVIARILQEAEAKQPMKRHPLSELWPNSRCSGARAADF